MVLSGQACVAKIAVELPPVLKSTVVEKTQLLCDDERHVAALQALPEHQQSANPPVAVLKRMNALKLHMEIQNVIQLYVFGGIVICKQRFYLFMHIFGLHRFITPTSLANFL